MARKSLTFEQRAFAALRKIWAFSPERREALKRAHRGGGKYECAHCAGVFLKKAWVKGKIAKGKTQTQVYVDHIVPVAPLEGWLGWDEHFVRLNVPPEKLQILCKACHQVKSNAENATRRKSRGRR